MSGRDPYHPHHLARKPDIEVIYLAHHRAGSTLNGYYAGPLWIQVGQKVNTHNKHGRVASGVIAAAIEKGKVSKVWWLSVQLDVDPHMNPFPSK